MSSKIKQIREIQSAWAFKDGKLYKFSNEENFIEVVRAWGPSSGAWRVCLSDAIPQWHSYRPSWVDLQHFTDLTDVYSGPDFWEQLTFPFLYENRDDIISIREFLRSIPRDVLKTVIKTAKYRHYNLLRLCERVPGGTDICNSNPALAYSLASIWIFHNTTKPLRTVRSLVRKRQKDIAGWLGFPPTQFAVNVLKKVSRDAITVDRILKLRGLLAAGECMWGKTLAHVPRINTGVIRLVTEQLPRQLVRPSLVLEVASTAEEEAFSNTCSDIKEIVLFAQLLNNHKVPPPFREITQVKSVHAEFKEMVKQRRKFIAPFPTPPLPAKDGFQPITTPGELFDVSLHDFSNCGFDYCPYVYQGLLYFYYFFSPYERAMVCIEKDDDRWKLRDAKLWANDPVSPETRKSIIDWLTTCQG